jgi:hypothetical protein
MTMMRALLCAIAILALPRLAAAADPAPAATAKPAVPWRGVHLGVSSNNAVDQLIEQVPKLAAVGINVVIVEVNYGFQFPSHPELHAGGRNGGITKDKAQALAAACKQAKIRLIPQLNCLGHQSWAARTAELLTSHPEFDETPGQYPQNKDIYCRSWCPQHPEVNKVVFALMDDLLDAFAADAFHVGMDEVFLIASPFCPRCKDKDPAELFAKAVNDYHGHLVNERHVEMLMWADRLIDTKTSGYSKWEAADNGTAPAIDKIPKDIILCDWHYAKRAEYASIPYFIAKGFRVWPSGWDKVDATAALIDFAQQHRGEKLLGHLCTTWGKAPIPQLSDFPPLKEAMKRWE